MTISRIEKLCIDKGLRMTEQRRVIARVLSDSVDHPDVAPRVDAVVDACVQKQIPVGTAIGADPRAAAKLAASGYSFVMVSNDASILGMGGRALVEGFRETLG